MAIYKDDIVSVELTTGTIFRSFLNRTLGEGDALANRFGVRVLNHGEDADLTGVTCSGYFIKSDGSTVVISNGTVEGNVAYVTLPQACYVTEGQFSLAIKLTGGNVTGTMRIVDGVVANTDTGSYVDPGTILPTIETLIATINAARETIPETYTDMQLDIQNLTGHEVFNLWEMGKAYKTSDNVIDPESPVSNSSFCCTYAECEEGETFTIYGYYGGTSNYQLYVFLDSEGNNLQRGPSTTAWYKNVEVKAPNDAAYLCVNLQKAYEHRLYRGSIRANIDEYAVKGSGAAVSSGGVYDELNEIHNSIGWTESPVSLTAQNGYYWNSENETAVLTSYESYRAYEAVTVTPGNRYRVKGWDGSSKKQNFVLLTDGDLKIKQRFGTRSSQNDVIFMVPTGVSKMLISSQAASAEVICTQLFLNTGYGTTAEGMFNYAGAKVAIIGDSISTNGDYSAANPLGNVPEIVIKSEDVGVELSAYVTYYDVGTSVGGHTITESEVGTEITFTPVAGDVGKFVGKPKNNNAASVVTWWEVAQEVLGFTAIPVCWSGSSITDHEENDQEDGHYVYKCAHAWHPSQIRKCGVRTAGSMTRTAPDMVIIYRGTNDLTHSPYSRITDYMDDWPNDYPAGDTSTYGGSTVYDYAKGIRLTIKKIRDAYPETQIVLCTLNYFRRLHTDKPFTYNDYDNWMKYNAMIRRIAEHEGCDLIEFDKDGLTWSNAANDYYQEGSSSTANWTHPTTKGHAVMGNRALIDLRGVNKK